MLYYKTIKGGSYKTPCILIFKINLYYLNTKYLIFTLQSYYVFFFFLCHYSAPNFRQLRRRHVGYSCPGYFYIRQTRGLDTDYRDGICTAGQRYVSSSVFTCLRVVQYCHVQYVESETLQLNFKPDVSFQKGHTNEKNTQKTLEK